jgi:hypothetical protein
MVFKHTKRQYVVQAYQYHCAVQVYQTRVYYLSAQNTSMLFKQTINCYVLVGFEVLTAAIMQISTIGIYSIFCLWLYSLSAFGPRTLS